ncbi:MAG: HAD family phosphatase [Rubrivivax sp.]|nr:HAD family phosphatase [Rubrivivax sp.]
MTAALIFDMDGLLLDTESLYLEATQALLAPYGYTVELEQYADWIGRNVDGEEFAALYPIPLTFEEAWAQVSRHFHALCAEKLRLQPGVLEFLDGPAAPYPKAVASSSPLQYIHEHLTQVGLLERFVVRVSAREVARGKPAPDVFLEAARRLGVRPEQCVVFEDSPHGIAGAKAAGMRAVAVLTPHTRHLNFRAADRVVERIDAIDAAWLRAPGPARAAAPPAS